MIGYLKGEVLEHADGRILVLVVPGGSERSGVGYSVSVPQSGCYAGLVPGKAAELYVHTHVREDALELYGFVTSLEKQLFLDLMAVNGIGPKLGMAILSAVE